MGILDRFRKKQETNIKIGTAKVVTELDKFFGNDKETVEALTHTMLLDPRKANMKSREALEKASKFEKAKNTLMASTWYQIAGGLAIYEGDAEGVAECFGKCRNLTPISEYTILNDPEKFVAKAQEYYKQILKS
jgi:hypothetical protein